MNLFNDNALNNPSTGPAYQVLARKWRPRSFEQMVGQEHVLKALINALNSNRLHHAYLFTGTRGIGKTTVARILAKCLNCDQGISATPCGTCSTCTAIDQGKYVDLIEVDAASRTKVEDTRELLDNVQYLPSQGRYKVYLIDEVHMLSGHSFNALLKTLEEPPAHVKFLLATTDPQRLPITILSRCLQFHLKRLSPERIATHLANVLQKELITYDQPALLQLGKAADGSMRDALSLLDQAISFGGGHVAEQDVNTMLGTIEQTYIWNLLEALTDNNADALMAVCAALAEDSADFALALEELLSCFHQMAVAQAVPNTATEPNILRFAQLIPGEELQLYYQIGLIGRRDLSLAPTPRIGFEMVLLRMLAYCPAMVEQPTPQAQQTIKQNPPVIEKQQNINTPSAEKNFVTVPTTIATQTAPALTPTKAPEAHIEPVASSIVTEIAKPSIEGLNWLEILPKLKLSGLSYTLASHCILKELTSHQIHLIVDAAFSAMLSSKLQQNLNEAFNQFIGTPIKLTIEVGANGLETPALIQKRQQSELHQTAVDALQSDPIVQQLTQQFAAKVELSTLKLKD